ncbi:MAG: hypothetical protein KGJ78_03955 [Alphaproteobacteria bacterium]|nr:hypothetical protein [Alphaproteobacteria bacterium]
MRDGASAVALMGGILLAAVTPSAGASTDALTDGQLVSRAAAVFAVKQVPADPVLGIHHGIRVIVDIRCGDICPAYTVRIIHYDMPAGAECTKMGADIATVMVPRSIAVGQENFCVPHVLYGRKMYVDRPYQK